MYKRDDYLASDPAWCPGCGDFAIRKALAGALAELSLPPHKVVICSGIGQAAKMPHYIHANGFNGLHGRALPPALGIRFANPGLKVIVSSGDGDSYGEGGNHFIHTVRRNLDIAHFVHDNQIYGLTKGQASPTSDIGMVTTVQAGGVSSAPLNPLALALIMGAGFVARCFANELKHLQATMQAAIEFPGYALIDILQPCPSFNKVNTAKWYRERVYMVEDHDMTDWQAALTVSREWGDKIPLGVFYNVPRATYESSFPFVDGEPLATRAFDPVALEHVQDEFL